MRDFKNHGCLPWIAIITLFTGIYSFLLILDRNYAGAANWLVTYSVMFLIGLYLNSDVFFSWKAFLVKRLFVVIYFLVVTLYSSNKGNGLLAICIYVIVWLPIEFFALLLRAEKNSIKEILGNKEHNVWATKNTPLAEEQSEQRGRGGRGAG